MLNRLFSSIALCAMLLTSCETLSEPTDAPNSEYTGDKFSITSGAIVNIDAKGGDAEIEYIINYEVEGAELTASSADSWITIINVGESVTFSADANLEAQQRIGIISLSYADTTINVGVQQLGSNSSNTEINIAVTSDRVMSFNSLGGDGTITYTVTDNDNDTETQVTADSDSEWIAIIAIDSQSVDFTVAPNNNAEKRTGYIFLRYKSAELKVTIKQEAISAKPILSTESNTIKLGGEVKFTVISANQDITSEAKIYEYYSRKEVSNPYTPTAEGEEVFYAMYNNLNSDVLTLYIIPANSADIPKDSNPSSYDFKYRMLLIDHTGTNCGYCPNMMKSLETVEANSQYNDQYNIAMAHSYNNDDKAYSTTALAMRYYYQKTLGVLTGFPTLTYNYQYGDSAGSNLTYIYKHLDQLKREKQDAAVAVATATEGDDIIVTTAIKSKVSRQYKYNIYILEDNIYSPQYNATESWMNTHHNAIRYCYPELTQYEDISGEVWGYVNGGTTMTKTVRVPITNSSWVRQNLKILVVISAKDAAYNNKFEVVNTAMCPIDGSIGFEYIN